jgi:hypothetical protein
LVQNVISSPNGEKTSGWSAVTTSENGTRPEIESVYGRFNGNEFISVIDDLQGDGIYANEENKKLYDYKSYLRVRFTDTN